MKTSPHIQSKQALEEFDKKIVPIIENPLFEYNCSEGHELPKICTLEDIKTIKSFITSSHISLLQSVVELVRESKSIAIISQGTPIEEGLISKEDIIKKLEEEIKQINV